MVAGRTIAPRGAGRNMGGGRGTYQTQQITDCRMEVEGSLITVPTVVPNSWDFSEPHRIVLLTAHH
jgi:hypothetical protein